MHQVGVLSLSLQYAAPLTDSVSEVLGEARVRQVSVAARATDSVSELLEEARSAPGWCAQVELAVRSSPP